MKKKMKKILACLLALIMVVGTVFATTVDLESGDKTYRVNLKAEVPEGSGIVDDGDDTHTEDPETVNNNGLKIKVGYNPTGNTYSMGSEWATGQIRGLDQYSAADPLVVDLVSSTEGTETLQFYVAGASQTGETESFTVSFSSAGFKRTGSADTVTIDLKSEEVLGSASNGLSATNENATVTVKGEGGSTQLKFIYVARVDASWKTMPNYKAGTYTAEIAVTVAAI